MHVSFDESAYRTLKLFLISCRSTVGDEVLRTYFSYKGTFPVKMEELLGDFAWTIDKIPDNVFLKLKNYALELGKDVLTDKDICLYFASSEHLETAKKSCLIYPDLSNDQRIVGHLTLPVQIMDIDISLITGKVVYTGIPIRNLVNVFPELEVGDVVLVHFSTIVMVNPSREIVTQLFKIQQEFIKEEISKVKEINYDTTTDQAKEKIDKYNL